MTYKADLHNHLATFEHMPNFNKTLDIASKKLGKGGILGLVNGKDNRYEKFISQKGYERQDFKNCIYVPEKDILVVKGQEVFTNQGHLLAYGLEERFNLENSRNLEESLISSKDNKALIILPHPFFIDGLGPYLEKNKDLLNYFNGIEIFNGEALWGNKEAQEFYNKLKLEMAFGGHEIGACSFSDGHSLYEIGNCCTPITKLWKQNYNSATGEEIIDSLKLAIAWNHDFSIGYKKNFSSLGFLDHSIKVLPLLLYEKLTH